MTLADVLARVFGQVGNALLQRKFIDIVEEGPNRLVLDTNRGNFVFDKRRGVVSRNGKAIAKMANIKFVDIVRDKEAAHPLHWEITLYMSFFKRIRVGQTRDDAQASIVGARITEITGARPLAWKESHDIKR